MIIFRVKTFVGHLRQTSVITDRKSMESRPGFRLAGRTGVFHNGHNGTNLLIQVYQHAAYRTMRSEI